jgi:transcriptional regulator with XRE-family HTH domain
MLPVGYQIYLRRTELKLTQRELARRSGIPQPNLSNIEKGKQDVTVSTLRRIALGLDLSLGDFFGVTSRGGSEILMSRRVIEKLAQAIVRGGTPLTRKEAEVVKLFKEILPGKPKNKIRIRRIHQAWMGLKKQIRPSEINSLYERVRGLRRRIQ